MKKSIISIIATAAFVMSCNENIDFHDAGTKPIVQDEDLIAAGFEKTYSASDRHNSHFSIDGDSGKINALYLLQHSGNRSMSFLQTNRKTVTRNFKQGHPGADLSQKFDLKRDGALDILIVVDNSHSMEVYQERLAERFEPLLQHIGHTDWQIAVVTTDGYCRRNFGQVITREAYLADPQVIAEDFTKAIEAGTKGNPVERGIEMAIRGFRGDCGGEWAREASKKAVILISDEENCGSASNEGCGDGSRYDYFGPEQFAKMLDPTTKFYGILYDENVCSDNFYEKQPEDYYSLVSDSGGLWGPICQNDYSDLLTSISKDVGQEVVRKFDLNFTPQGDVVQIKVDGQLVDNSYSFDGNTLVLDGDLEENAIEVEISYVHDAVPMFDSIQIDMNADMETLKVSVAGQQLGASDYTISQSQTERSLHFASKPVADAEISVSFKDRSLLKNSFQIEDNAEPSSVRVNISEDPESMVPFYFDAEKSKVVFIEMPEDGAHFDITYVRKEDYKTEYPLPESIASNVVSVEVYDKKNGEKISAVLRDGYFRVDPDQIGRGREVEARFTAISVDLSKGIALPHEAIDGSLLVETDSCRWTAEKNESDPDLIFVDCDGDAPMNLKVSYDYYSRMKTTFDLPREVPPGSTWTVLIDGKPCHTFESTAKDVTIPGDLLTPESKINVKVEFSERI